MLARDVRDLTSTPSTIPLTPRVMLHRQLWFPEAGDGQQDTHEAVQHLLQRCDAVDVNAMYAQEVCRHMDRNEFETSAHCHSTPYNQIFGNLQIVNITCTACNAVSRIYERAHVQLLSLHNVPGDDLHALLNNFFAPDELDETFRCERCLAMGNGTKTVRVTHWPQVLLLGLKRFYFDTETGRPEKINRRITYTMDLPDIDDGNYRLRAVIVHTGQARFGHYYAYVRALNNTWYHCNDTALPRQVEPNTVLQQQNAYMLVYEKRYY